MDPAIKCKDDPEEKSAVRRCSDLFDRQSQVEMNERIFLKRRERLFVLREKKSDGKKGKVCPAKF